MDLKHRSPSFSKRDLFNRLNGGKNTASQENRGRLGLLYRLMSVLLAAIMVINCSLVSSVVQITPDSAGPAQGEVVPVSSPQLPVPPNPLAVSLQNPEQEAISLANALAGPDNLAAWLGLYQALGIPVISENRTALDGSDDPIGPPYWQVWYSASLDLPGHGIRLSDAGRLLGYVFELSPEDSQTIGDTLLSDLRLALDSQNPTVRLLGTVARERILHSGSKQDILDSATTAQTASIDVPTLQLIFWVVLRGALFQHSAQSFNLQGVPALVSYPVQRNTQQTGTFNCSEMFRDADTTYWVNWLVNKAFGGVQLPGMEKALPGLLEKALTSLGMSADTFSVASKAIGWTNVVGSAISLMMQISSMELVGIQAPDNLVRTKSTKDGNKTTITWRLASFPDNLPNGNEARQCFLSFVSNVLGVGFTFPGQSRIAGAELTFKAGKNIPERVYFGDYNQLRSWTDHNGEAKLLMLGKGQKKNLPESAKSVDEEFSVFVSAQPEESGLNSMANIFFGGLTFGAAPGLAGFISSLIDMLKTFSYDMGEHVFPMTDWEQKSYKASGGQKMNMIGTICDLEAAFQLIALGDNGVTYDFSFSPASDTAGSFQYSGSAEECIESGTGTYTILFNEDATLGTAKVEVSGAINCPDIHSTFSDSGSFDLTADPSVTCP